MVVEVPLSSAMPEPSEEDVSEMDVLMSDGKRNYICNQPQLAVECFVALCEKLATFYGQESDKCVEAYLYYGKTLLDIARLENGVLGHAIKEAPVFGSEDEGNENDVNTEDEEDITPEKRMDIRNHVEHAMREDNLYNQSTDDDQTEEDTEEEGGTEEKTETGGESSKTEEVFTDAGSSKTEKEESTATGSSKTEKEESTATGSSKTEKESTATGSCEKGESSTEGASAEVSSTTVTAPTDGDMEVDDGIDCNGSDGDDDVSNMELAWEMFELTAFICRRQLEDDSFDKMSVKSTMAEAKNGLAQISLETERYDEAANDFTECTKLFREILADQNDRRIAEAHYNIGLALSFDKKYTESIKEFENAVAILKAKVLDLEAKVKKSEEEGSKEPAPAELEEWKKEIQEINDLIVLDLMTKIEDATESKKLLDESIKTVKNAASEIFGALGGTKNEFDAGFDEGFDAPTSESTEVIHDCSDNIRSVKRKSDDESSDVAGKKIRPTVVAGTETASTEE